MRYMYIVHECFAFTITTTDVMLTNNIWLVNAISSLHINGHSHLTGKNWSLSVQKSNSNIIVQNGVKC